MSQPQNERLARWLNVFGAVLIVAGIIGVSFSVARSSRTASSGTATWGDGGPFTRVALADGLYFVMKVTPGPYFLGELLAGRSLAYQLLAGPPIPSATPVETGCTQRSQAVPAHTFHYRPCSNSILALSSRPHSSPDKSLRLANSSPFPAVERSSYSHERRSYKPTPVPMGNR